MQQRRASARVLSVVAMLTVALVVQAAPADAHRRHGRHVRKARASRSARAPRGFEPTDRVLECIRGPWNGDSMESGGNYGEPGSNWDPARRSYDGFATAYQMDDDFARAYSAPIPDERWALWGSTRSDPPWTWPVLIQDETARNGVRARGLSPWPKPNRVCPRS